MSYLWCIWLGLPGLVKMCISVMWCMPASRLGHETKHFNVGSYRRKQRGEDEIQEADFFDHNNTVGTLLC